MFCGFTGQVNRCFRSEGFNVPIQLSRERHVDLKRRHGPGARRRDSEFVPVGEVVGLLNGDGVDHKGTGPVFHPARVDPTAELDWRSSNQGTAPVNPRRTSSLGSTSSSGDQSSSLSVIIIIVTIFI
jgi:hypothetical protein